MTRTVQLISDFHLDYNRGLPWDKLLIPKSDILVVAGDIFENNTASLLTMKDFAEYVAQRFKKIYFVPGNHDYYGSSHQFSEASLQKIWSNHPNTMYLQCKTDSICPGWRIIGCTMWSDIPEKCKLPGFNDFTRISDFTREAYATLHRDHVRFLSSEIATAKKEGLKTIVVTHHAPLKVGTSDPIFERKYRTMNHAFATDLSSLVRETNIWAFGHTHWKVTGLKCDKAELFSNPLGYGNECPDFDPGCLLYLRDDETKI